MQAVHMGCQSSRSLPVHDGGVGVRAVVFDFDQTLTVIREVPRHRLFPGFDAREPDRGWLREVAFGGSERLERLVRALEALKGSGLELFILSFADRQVILRALELVDALRFFAGEGLSAERIYGWEDFGDAFGGQDNKKNFLGELLQRRRWRHEEVLFVDDQKNNVEAAKGVCRTYRVLGGRGLRETELSALSAGGAAGLLALQGQGEEEEDEDMDSNASAKRSRGSSLASFSSAEEQTK